MNKYRNHIQIYHSLYFVRYYVNKMKSTLNYLATSLNMQTIGKVNFCKTKAELIQKNRHYMHAWTH